MRCEHCGGELVEVDRLKAAYAGAQQDAEDAEVEGARVSSEVDRLRAENAELQHSNEYHQRYRYTAEQNAHNAALEARKLRAERDALAAKLDAANARIAELEELKCSVCGKRVAHLNANGYVIGWGCADGEECKPDPQMPEPHEEWAIRVVKTPGGSSWYHHEASAETAEDDRAQVLEILAESRDLAGQPVEHGPVSIVRRTVWASEWEAVPESTRPASALQDQSDEHGSPVPEED